MDIVQTILVGSIPFTASGFIKKGKPAKTQSAIMAGTHVVLAFNDNYWLLPQRTWIRPLFIGGNAIIAAWNGYKAVTG